ncbi:hypothetical protein ACFLVS_06060 [Chloroflexota bacterium]
MEDTESPFQRLGYFLIASAFLVATFIQLVIAADTADTLSIYIHFVAGLGLIIAFMYTFMNWWRAWIANPHKNQLLHTWLVPLFFLIFWVLAWIEASIHWTEKLCLSLVILLITLVVLSLGFWLTYMWQKGRGNAKEAGGVR